MIEHSRKRTAKRLSLANPPIALGLVLCVFGAVLHSIQLYREIEQLKTAPEASPGTVNLHLFFILAFVTCVVGSLLRSRLGLSISIFSLTVALLIYSLWYTYSLRLLRVIRESGPALAPPELIPSHPLSLVYANWLDFAILFAVVIVLAWQMKFLISTFRHRNEPK